MKQQRTFFRCLLLVVLASLVGLGGTPAFAGQNPAKSKSQGRFKVEYGQATIPEYRAVLKELSSAKALETVADDLNSSVRIPKDITIAFDECGEANAFYQSETRRVSICLELLARFAEVFADDATPVAPMGGFVVDDGGAPGDEGAYGDTGTYEVEPAQPTGNPDDALVGATFFILFHELGHALVDVLDLPITGKEEDAVDQLSTLVLVGDDDGEAAAINGARYFYLEYLNNGNAFDDLAFADEHSLEAQRFYNIMCWVYGQNQAKFSYMVSDGILPEERAERCAYEYQRLEKAWGTLLEPYLI